MYLYYDVIISQMFAALWPNCPYKMLTVHYDDGLSCRNYRITNVNNYIRAHPLWMKHIDMVVCNINEMQKKNYDDSFGCYNLDINIQAGRLSGVIHLRKSTCLTTCQSECVVFRLCTLRLIYGRHFVMVVKRSVAA